MDPTELERSLVAVFLEESGEGLERAEAGLLRLEGDGSRELIEELFRAVHSIKGGAGVVGMIELGPLAHAMESVLDGMRRGQPATAEITSALLRGVDALRAALAARSAGAPTTAERHAHLTAEIEQLAHRGAAAAERRRPRSRCGRSSSRRGPARSTACSSPPPCSSSWRRWARSRSWPTSRPCPS